MRGLRGVLLLDGAVVFSFWCAKTFAGAVAAGSFSEASFCAVASFVAARTFARFLLERVENLTVSLR